MWDWPAAVILFGVVLLLGGVQGGAVLVLVGGLALLIRRGAFTPRRR